MKKYLESKYDVFYNDKDLVSYSGSVFPDHQGLSLAEVDGLLCDLEYTQGRMWLPIEIPDGMCKFRFYHIIYTLYLHNFIVCFPNEIRRNEDGTLEGESSILKKVLASNFLKNATFKKGFNSGNRKQ